MQQTDTQFAEDLLAQLVVHLDRGLKLLLCSSFSNAALLDERIDDVNLLTLGDDLPRELPNLVSANITHRTCHDRSASWRQFIDHAYVEIAIDGHRQSSRNWCRSHD